MGTFFAGPKENSPITTVMRCLGDLGRNQLAKRQSSVEIMLLGQAGLVRGRFQSCWIFVGAF